jgi:hypothetical protein
VRRSVVLALLAVAVLVVLAAVAEIYQIGGRGALGYVVAVVWLFVIGWAVYQRRSKDPNKPS